MGLDIYLNRYTMFSERCDAETERESAHEKIWDSTHKKKSETMTEQERDTASKACEAYDATNPLPGSAETIEIASAKYPEHLFKIGYLRSSYNDGGINRILRVMLGKDLASIFAVDGETYKVKPDWSASLERARALLDEFNAHVETHGFYRVMTSRHNPYITSASLPTDEAAALKIFEGVNKTQKGSFGSRDGDFFLTEELRVKAIIPGTTNLMGSAQCLYVVYEGDHQWYRQALEIIVEMCEWVLAQPVDPAVEWVLHWSG